MVLFTKLRTDVIACCISWYSVSSLTSQLNKSILSQFNYPIFLGEFQFIFSLTLGAFTIWLVNTKRYSFIKKWFPSGTFPTQPKYNDCISGTILDLVKKSNRDIYYLGGIFPISYSLIKLYFPMGTFQFIGKILSLAATGSCSVATVSSIRALSPLFIVLGYRFWYKISFSLKTYISLMPLLAGVIMIMLSQYAIVEDIVNSVHTDQIKEIIDDSDISQSDSTFFELVLNTIHYGTSKLNEEYEFFKGVTFAFLATAIFAANSIYTKNVISTGSGKLMVKEKNNLAKLALSSSQINLISASEIDLEAQKEIETQSYQLHPQQQPHSPLNSHFYNSENKNQNQNENESESENENSFSNYNYNIPAKLTTLMYCSLFGLLYSIPAFLTYELPLLLSSQISRISLASTVPTTTELIDTTLVTGTLGMLADVSDNILRAHNDNSVLLAIDIPSSAVSKMALEAIPDYHSVPWTLLILNGLSYFTQSLLAFQILGMLSTVSYSIAAMMKRIVVITVSIIILGKSVSPLGIFGIFCVGSGLLVYDRWGGRRKGADFKLN